MVECWCGIQERAEQQSNRNRSSAVGSCLAILEGDAVRLIVLAHASTSAG